MQNILHEDEQSLQSIESNVSNSIDESGHDSGQNLNASGSFSHDDVKLARKESKFVLCSKFMAYMVLFLCATGAGVAAFYFTRDQETADFESDVSSLNPCDVVYAVNFLINGGLHQFL